MPTFKYIARKADGERVDGTIDASDRNSALLAIQRLGHTPFSVTETKAAVNKKEGGTRRLKLELGLGMKRKTRMTQREMLLFTREMADLLSSGMTLGRALHTLSGRNPDSAQHTVIERLRDEVVQGSSLSEALAIYPETFPQLYLSMVKAGEASGAISESLEGLCHHFERVAAAREKVLMALLYPSIVLTVGVLAVIGLMLFIVPSFSGIFEELGGTLPLPTRIMMAMSNGLINYWWLILLLLGGGGAAARHWLRTPEGRLWWHKKQLKLPVIRHIACANAFAHFSRTLETLTRNGVPILRAMGIVHETVGNRLIASEIAEARDRVTDGSSISGPLAAGKIFPQMLTDMLAVGEETGDLAGALRQITRRYDEELDRAVKILTTVLEPLLILGVAILVGFVAVSMLMAVFDLTSGLGA